jgi:hypothetical protein
MPVFEGFFEPVGPEQHRISLVWPKLSPGISALLRYIKLVVMTAAANCRLACFSVLGGVTQICVSVFFLQRFRKTFQTLLDELVGLFGGYSLAPRPSFIDVWRAWFTTPRGNLIGRGQGTELPSQRPLTLKI